MIQNIELENAQILRYGNNQKILFTCDHATNILPNTYEWSENDQINFTNTHWAIDIGALNLAKVLAQETESRLVHSKFSRLFCDVNRQVESETLFREQGDGNQIELNQKISVQDQWQRIQYHASYHFGVRQVIHDARPKFIYSIHSFTPVYEGQQREVEIGILTSLFDEFGEDHQKLLKSKGYDCRINEPYSGKKGINYSINRYMIEILSACLSVAQPILGTMFEVRNDILMDPDRFKKVSQDILETIIEVSTKWQ